MESQTVKIIKSKTIIHSFYCDKCKQKIEDIEEWADGYVPSPESFRTRIGIDHKFYKVDILLCDKCKKGYVDELTELLIQHGFKLEKYNH